jgi:hypothetical protein
MQGPAPASKRPRLIADWRRAWRFSSVQAAVLLAFLSAVQADVLPLLQPLFSDRAWPLVSGGLGLLIVVVRLLAQPSLHPPATPPADSEDGARP